MVVRWSWLISIELSYLPNPVLDLLPLACLTLSRDPKRVFLQPADEFFGGS
jgi:hypothetical protein